MSRWVVGAAAFVAFGATAAPALAQSCRIPRALLCEGCAERLTLTLLGNGRCVVSAAPAASGHRSDGVVIRVVRPWPPAPGLRSIRRREPRITPLALHPGPRCFLFQERRYCE